MNFLNRINPSRFRNVQPPTCNDSLTRSEPALSSFKKIDIEHVCKNLHTGSVFKPNESARNIIYMENVCDEVISSLKVVANKHVRNVIFEGLAIIADKSTTGALNRVVSFDNKSALIAPILNVVPIMGANLGHALGVTDKADAKVFSAKNFQDVTKLENISNKAREALFLDPIKRGQQEFSPLIREGLGGGGSHSLGTIGLTEEAVQIKKIEMQIKQKEELVLGPPPKVQGSQYLADLKASVFKPPFIS